MLYNMTVQTLSADRKQLNTTRFTDLSGFKARDQIATTIKEFTDNNVRMVCGRQSFYERIDAIFDQGGVLVNTDKGFLQIIIDRQ